MLGVGKGFASRHAGILFAGVMIALAPASRSAALAAELIEGRCRMDVCSWFSIERKDVVGASSKGTLFRVTSRWWSSEHPGGSYKRRTPRTGGETVVEYVMCSKTSPAVLSESDGNWDIALLDIGGRASISGASWTIHVMYFAVCHGIDSNKVGLDRLNASAGRRFGYQVDPDSLERDMKISRAEDILE